MKQLLLLITLLILWPVEGFPQQPVPVVTLDMQQVPVLEVMLELEKQTGVLFSYESSLLNELPRVSLKAEEEPLSYCLKKLFTSLPIVYRITGKYVVLKRKPKQFTISGFVRDSVSYESLINATVLDMHSGRGVTSNNYGFYSITLPAGEYLLRVSYVGFDALEYPVVLAKDTMIDMPLAPLSSLQEVVVEGIAGHSELLNTRTGGMQLSAYTLQKVPAVLGEADLIKVLQQTPGVASGTEILTGMYVRGGNGDENLFLLDGNPVYHVNHLGGVFSTFNPDAVKNVEFYKGSFPARYGGRLSSVIDVRMKEGDMQEYHGDFSIGLLSAKAAFEGPIVKDRTSFNVSFRRTWLDAITTPALAINRKVNKDNSFLGYSFYDLNAKMNHIINPKHRLYLSVYAGQDRFRYRMDEKEEALREEATWRWGNFLGTLKWNCVISNKLFANLSVNYTRYKSKMREEDQALTLKEKPQKQGAWEKEMLSHIYRFNSSGIEDLGYRLDFDYTPLPEHRVRFGSDYQYHTYLPEKKRTQWGEYEQGEWIEKILSVPNRRSMPMNGLCMPKMTGR
ncbi:MAG: TonB-dependent receptor [Tannerellaceae bacterium]|nr:TonB-dependent receptor [Tannerellaceae bacterium]MCD8264945.1 TonB-dependent receptor [Tannerellaceae bacterium]